MGIRHRSDVDRSCWALRTATVLRLPIQPGVAYGHDSCAQVRLSGAGRQTPTPPGPFRKMLSELDFGISPAEKTFGSVVFTSADLVDGATYTVTIDGATAATVTEGTATAGGMAGMGGGPGGGGQRP